MEPAGFLHGTQQYRIQGGPDRQPRRLEVDHPSPGQPPKSGTAVHRAIAVSVAKIAIEKAIKMKTARPLSKQ
jgi:hypothetical protein